MPAKAARRPKPRLGRTPDPQPTAPADPLGAALQRALATEPDEQLRALVSRLLAGDEREPDRDPNT